jgi:hypothetical protein
MQHWQIKPPPFQLTRIGVYFSMPSKNRLISSASLESGSPSDHTRRLSPVRNTVEIAATRCR